MAKPAWYETAEKVLHESNLEAKVPMESDISRDMPGIQKEHEIAVNKQRNTLLKHQNQLLYYMICAIEAQSSSNPNFRGSNAIKAGKILDQSLLYD
tara:strand:+ start:17498 stop:17785 length:288 start_codon:yes stop_codon:yes gene_type:complete